MDEVKPVTSSPLPPAAPKGGWIRNVPRGPIAFMPYLVYIYGQVLFNNRGALGYEFLGNGDEGFVLYLKVEPDDRIKCESLFDTDEVWIRLRPRGWRT